LFFGKSGLPLKFIAPCADYKDKESIMLKWTTEEIEKVLRQVVATLGRFPTQQQLAESGRNDLKRAIDRSDLTYHDWAIRLGHKPNCKPQGYWKDFDNLRREIEAIVVNGKFPTLDMISSRVGHTARHAIYEYHGSIADVAKKMGYEPPAFFVTTDGHHVLSSNEYLFDEYLHQQRFEHEVNSLIVPGVSQYRYDFKVGEVYFEIWGYEADRQDGICGEYNRKRKLKEELYAAHGRNLVSLESDFFQCTAGELMGKLDALMSDLGLTPTDADLGPIENAFKHCRYWSEDRVLAELEAIRLETGEVPSFEQLKQSGRSDLAYAAKEHGGFVHYRKLLGTKVRTEWTEEKVESELKAIIEKDGKFPVQSRLKELDRWDLLRAINKFGGFVKWHERMGFQPTRALNGSWTEERVKAELFALSESEGRLLTYSEVRKADKRLASAVDRLKVHHLLP
jgi:hypothetical protein